ncbi:MAG: DUF362 domain-containing protein [Bryobacteraceae bacterium]|nr:DUF362 domain-containing protein [Bryobacteraceae bacterium]
MVNRRSFLQYAAAASLAGAEVSRDAPKYRVVSSYKPAADPGMPGPYAGQVVAVHSNRCLDENSEKVDAAAVREMIERGMRELTGEARAEDAWRRFISPDDVVGIKVNCSGAPKVMSSPEIVGEIARNLVAIGVKPDRIYLYERFQGQVDSVNYPAHLPTGVQIVTAEARRGGNQAYDPAMYVEVDFFGEEDTRSNAMRVVTRTLTKIINVPNMKDHGASGVTGCLKNIAYGSFSNVARSHQTSVTYTLSFIGTLAASEPVRSKTVLQIMDGLKGVWHAGPFVASRRFVFFPKQIHIGTDPVAIDRLLIDTIDDKRKQMKAISVWDRNPKTLGSVRDRDRDPNVNVLIREPGHIEYAANLGLGVYDIEKIRVRKIEL